MIQNLMKRMSERKEEDVRSAARKIKEYCTGRACKDCIFYQADHELKCHIISGLPIDWEV